MGLVAELVGYAAEVVEGGAEVFDYLDGDEFGAGEAIEVLAAVVFEPENVEVEFVAVDEFLVAEATEAFGLGAVAIAGDEVVEVTAH